MDYTYVFIVLCTICAVFCDEVQPSTEGIPVQKADNKNSSSLLDILHPAEMATRTQRGLNVMYIEMISCAMKYDALCFVDVAEEYLEVKRNELLAQADMDALKATGRSDPDSTPSHLAKVIAKLVRELTNLWKDGLSGYFTGAREAGDDDEEEDDDSTAVANSDQNGSSRGSNGVKTNDNAEARKKKKKPGIIHQLLYLLKFLIIGAIIYFKILLLLKTAALILKFKYFLLAAGALALHAIKVWTEVKHKKQHGKVIYYEQAHHDHHYDDHGDIEVAPSGWDDHGDHGSYWSRRYDQSGDENAAHNMAYSGQKPTSSSIYSLLG